jgi:hypothetical protein
MGNKPLSKEGKQIMSIRKTKERYAEKAELKESGCEKKTRTNEAVYGGDRGYVET